MGNPDLIAVVESCYDLAVADTEWLQNVADSFQDVLKPEHGLLAYHVDVDRHGFHIRSPVQSRATPENMVARIEAMAALLDKRRSGEAGLLDRAKAKVYESVIKTGMKEPADHVVHSEYRRVGPEWMYTLGAPIEDTFTLMSHHIDDNGMTALVGGLKHKRRFRPAQRATFQMISAHIKAGLRLRRRLPSPGRSVEVPAEGAVLSPSGRVLHAGGEAKDHESREELRDSAQRIDRARSKQSDRGEEALAAWQGLIRGRWSLVEAFDADGKRFLLAHRNPENVRDPRGLSTMESRVVGLAVRGYADGLIAYHLGISEGTASSHLSRAMRKLKIKNRVELVRRLGRRYPQEALR